jgi:transcriptional regulator with XRE-family HTH domain
VHHEAVEPENLSGFLRQARARVSPSDVGLPSGTRRRVAGLRREEVAQLANISVDYLVRLEQGRSTGVSDAVLVALARALQLSDDERIHLFHLAGSAPPRPGQIDSVVRASTIRVLERLVDLPAMVLDAKGDVLAWNALATALLGDFSAWAPPTRNIVWQRFLGHDLRVSSTAEEGGRTAAESVASLRAVAARYPDDVGLRRLIDQLRSGSRDFVELWDQSRPQERRSTTKTVRHPELGSIQLDCDALHLPDSDQRMIVYSAPPHSSAADALALLRVIGLQRLDESGPVAALRGGDRRDASTDKPAE